MAREDSREPGDENGGAASSGAESAEPIAISTSDPAVANSVEHDADWRIHPDSTLSLETTQVHEPSPLYVVGVRKVVHEEQESQSGRQNADAGQKPEVSKQSESKDANGHAGNGSERANGGGAASKANDQGKPHQKDADNKNKREPEGKRNQSQADGKDAGEGGRESERSDRDDPYRDEASSGQRSQHQPQSMMKTLLMTALIATVCGLAGAFGYSYFAGGGKGSDEKGQGQSKSGSSSGKSSKNSGGGKSKQGSNESDQGQSSASTQVAAVAAKEIGTLNQQLVDLMVRVDRLGERVDRIVRPNDETPPVVQSIQVEIGEIFHEIDKLNAVGDKVRLGEQRVETLERELKILQSKIDEAVTAKREIGDAKAEVPGSAATAGNPADNTTFSNEILEQGVRLLEQGQYEAARMVFERIKQTKPADARLWYFAAIAVGLATNDWNDDANELAERGAACERAGQPPAGEIDAALATRGPAAGKSWLSAFRRRSLSTNATPRSPR